MSTRSIARAGRLELARERDEHRWVTAVGKSMRPTIKPGDRLLVAAGRLPTRVGQVVLVQREDTAVAHRVVGRRGRAADTLWLTKGDGEAFMDAPVERDVIVGLVVGVGTADGQVRRSLFDGRRAAGIGRASGLAGRLAWTSRRLARRLPSPVDRAAGNTLVSLSRVPTRVMTAPLAWLDQVTRAGRR